jgi:hypothetical protein
MEACNTFSCPGNITKPKINCLLETGKECSRIVAVIPVCSFSGWFVEDVE